jgi:cytochrome c oxidase cbb3-type subunit 2
MSKGNFFYNLEKSAVVTVVGVILLFSASILVVMVAPNFTEKSWIEPTSDYQVQMYKIADPHVYIGKSQSASSDLSFVWHIRNGFTPLAFQEDRTTKILAPPDLQKYITAYDSVPLRLTSKLLLLRQPEDHEAFKAKEMSEKMRLSLQDEWVQNHPNWKEEGLLKPDYSILELYEPSLDEAFVNTSSEGVLENWVDNGAFLIEGSEQESHNGSGVIYVLNPMEYRLGLYSFGGQSFWRYDPKGMPIKNLEELNSHPLGFLSRQELIRQGEEIYKIEGCWYCHTDQTRTLVQDVVLNGSDSYPAPPSTSNEYIYQEVTFPGTRRIGPDLSRVGIKRPSRDWHKGHFWSPKTASQGSIMPAFRHFFDNDPRGTAKSPVGVPNHKFEAIYQYLMTKGTRITPPTQAWWLGKDPIQTKEIIEGQRQVP